MRTLFVTGTGTGIGKTLVTAALAYQLRAQGRRARVLKPVVTGLDDTPLGDSDPGVLLAAQGETPTPESLARVAPFRYGAPLAPAMAAAREGRPLSPEAILTFCREAMAGPEDCLLIEGVGGLMVPMTERWTVADWLAALGVPALLVAGSYLGTLSHTLTALEVLARRAIPVQGIIISESEEPTVGLAETISALAPFTQAPILGLPRLRGAEAWRRAPNLIPIAFP